MMARIPHVGVRWTLPTVLVLMLVPFSGLADSGDPLTYTEDAPEQAQVLLVDPSAWIRDADLTGRIDFQAHGVTYTLDATPLDLSAPGGTNAYIEDEVLGTTRADPSVGSVRTYQVSLQSYPSGSGVLTLSPTSVALLVSMDPCRDLIIEMAQGDNRLHSNVPTRVWQQQYGDPSSPHCQVSPR